jgi:hypothetical protein
LTRSTSTPDDNKRKCQSSTAIRRQSGAGVQWNLPAGG